MITIRNRGGRARRRNQLISTLALAVFVVASAAIAAQAAASRPSVSVLCYHTFLNKKKMDPYCFTIEELASQIGQLKSKGFRFVSIGDVVSGKITGSKNVLVTIDDGNRSVYEAFQKVFKPNGIRPLLGIYPNVIDKKKYALTWEQLSYLANNGCDIAGHGFFHLKINQKLKDTNPKYFRMEIFKTKQVLEEKLNRTITVFLYPFGLKTDVGMAALKEAGYRYAFTIKRGRIDLPVSTAGDAPLELPRYMVTRTTWNLCYSKILKNAGMKAGSSIAAAEDGHGRTLLTAVNSYPLMNDADPIARLEERLTSRPAPVSLKLEASSEPDKPVKHGKIKKKREEEAGPIAKTADAGQHDGSAPKDKDRQRVLMPEKPSSRIMRDSSPGYGRAQKDRPRIQAVEKPVFRAERDVPAIAAPIQRVSGNVHRDVLGLDTRNPEIFDDTGARSAGRISLDVLSPAGAPDRGAGAAFKGKIDRNAGGYHAGLKKRYRALYDGSQKSYDGFLDRIRDKLERYKTKIRKYVIRNF